MSNTSRRKFAPDFKAKVSLAAVKEQQTIEEICKKYDLHPSQVNAWKKQFLSEASVVFERTAKKEVDEIETFCWSSIHATLPLYVILPQICHALYLY